MALNNFSPTPFDTLRGDLQASLGRPDAPPQTLETGADHPHVAQVAPHVLVNRALQRIDADHGRDECGRWLATQCRDNRIPKEIAEEAMRKYQQRVPPLNTKGEVEDYTLDEALRTLDFIYAQEPRAPWDFSKRKDKTSKNYVKNMGSVVLSEPKTKRGPPNSLPYRPFPVDELPPVVSRYVRFVAEALGCDPAFVALPVFGVLAGCIGNARVIQLKPTWMEVAVLWLMTIGKPGTMKSPAYEIPLKPVHEWQKSALREYHAAMDAYRQQLLQYDIALASYKRSAASGGTGPPPDPPQLPICKRIVINDVTVEALVSRLSEQMKINWPKGLIEARDELAGWIKGFDAYKRGGGDAQRWLEMHRAGPISSDRKGDNSPMFVPRAAVSVIGTTQLGTLTRIMTPEMIENGMQSRVLMAMPPSKLKKWTEDPCDTVAIENYAQLITNLIDLEFHVDPETEERVPMVRTLSASAKEAWKKFYNAHAEEAHGLGEDLAAPWAKLEAYAARFALIFHEVKVATHQVGLNPEEVDEQSIRSAVNLVQWFKYETRRIYAFLGENEFVRDHKALVEIIRSRSGRITVRDLLRSTAKFSSSADAEEALEGFVKEGYGRWIERPPTAKGGRPTREFELNDAIDIDIT